MNVLEQIEAYLRTPSTLRSREVTKLLEMAVEEIKRPTRGDAVPLKGPPDGWPRLKCGTLARQGMTVYRDGGSKSQIIYLGSNNDANITVDSAGAYDQWVTLDSITAAPPAPPVTIKSALRELVEAYDGLDCIRQKIALGIARQFLAQQPSEPAEPIPPGVYFHDETADFYSH